MTADAGSPQGWCSLRLRFDERELELLRGSEHIRGAAMAHTARPDELRSALTLAKAGQKVARAAAGTIVVLDENELGLLLEALRQAVPQVQAAARASADHMEVLAAFPELEAKGTWRAFGLVRDLEALANRLSAALGSD
jgi:hypothetical protein